MSASNNEIFDYVIQLEDKLLDNVRDELKSKVFSVYGESGVKVVEKYYRQIDGEEDFDNVDVDDCSDCKEKAKKLVEILDLLKEFNEIITTDSYEEAVKSTDFTDVLKAVDSCVFSIKQNSCLDIDLDMEKKIKVRLLLEISKGILKK